MCCRDLKWYYDGVMSESELDNLAENHSLKAEFDQFMRELAGLNVGRNNRFIESDEEIRLKEKKEERHRQQIQVARQVREHEEMQERIDDLKTRLRVADATSYDDLMQARENLDAILLLIVSLKEDAHKLDDGRAAFLSRDGTWAIDENGEMLTEEELASIEWVSGKPSAEDYKAATDARSEAELSVSQIETFRDDLEASSATLTSGQLLTESDLDEIDALLKANTYGDEPAPDNGTEPNGRSGTTLTHQPS